MSPTKITVLSAVTLTATFSENTGTIVTADVETLHLDISYTPLSGQTDRYLELLVEESSDAVTWFPRATISEGNGYASVFNHGIFRGPFNSSGVIATTGGQVYLWALDFPTASYYQKLSLRESGSNNFGVATLKATCRHQVGSV